MAQLVRRHATPPTSLRGSLSLEATWLLTMADVAGGIFLGTVCNAHFVWIVCGHLLLSFYISPTVALQLVSIPNPTHFRAWLNSTTQLFCTHAATHMWVISKNDPKYGRKTIHIYMYEWMNIWHRSQVCVLFLDGYCIPPSFIDRLGHHWPVRWRGPGTSWVSKDFSKNCVQKASTVVSQPKATWQAGEAGEAWW